MNSFADILWRTSTPTLFRKNVPAGMSGTWGNQESWVARKRRWFAHKSVDGKLIGVQTCPDFWCDRQHQHRIHGLHGWMWFSMCFFFLPAMFSIFPSKKLTFPRVLRGYSQLHQILNGSEQLVNKLHNKSWKDIGAKKKGDFLLVLMILWIFFEDSRCESETQFCPAFKRWLYHVNCCDLLRCTLQWAEAIRRLLGQIVAKCIIDNRLVDIQWETSVVTKHQSPGRIEFYHLNPEFLSSNQYNNMEFSAFLLSTHLFSRHFPVLWGFTLPFGDLSLATIPVFVILAVSQLGSWRT